MWDVAQVNVEAVRDPITICVTASPFAAQVGAGDVPDVVFPSGMSPASSPVGQAVADLDRYRVPNMPGGKQICRRLESARADDAVLIVTKDRLAADATDPADTEVFTVLRAVGELTNHPTAT